MQIATAIYDYIRRQDVEAFRDAAQRFGCHLLVRRTNPASLQYIGRSGYVPKPIDCKPKTADQNVIQPSGQIVRCAGLVVDPTRPGFDKAFRGGKHGKALKAWREFAAKHGLGGADLYSGKAYLDGYSIGASGEAVRFTVDRGGIWAIQPEPDHTHYGCLMFCPFQLSAPFPSDARAAIAALVSRPTSVYVHGDYDLFAVVPADMPEVKSVKQAILFGVENSYGQRWREIAEYLNRRIGAPMVQHGAEDSSDMETGEEEHVDVFWAGGDVTEVAGRTAIERLYAVEFAGRAKGAQSSGLIRRR